MRTLSFPTLGLLIELADELFDQRTELVPLMMRCDLLRSEHGGEVPQVFQNNLLGARSAAEAGDQQAHRNLLRLVQLIIEKRANHPRGMSRLGRGDLREALLADGYELTWEPTSHLPNDYTARCKILPTDAAPVPLAAETSALEAELTARGYTSVLNHYRQAVDGLANHKYESANGDLRTTLEDLVTRLAEERTGYQRRPGSSQGGAAIAHMIDGGYLPEDGGGMLLRGLWRLSHTNGSHPGEWDQQIALESLAALSVLARWIDSWAVDRAP